METMSDRIKEILESLPGPDRGKQTRLAEIAECTKALINQLLKNPAQTLGYEYARNIEKKLGYRVDWVLNGHLPKFVTDEAPMAAPSVGNEVDEMIEMMLLFRQASPKDRDFLLTSARALNSKAIDKSRSTDAATND